MYLLAGLGNPGSSYAGHRHNLGFMAIDAIAEAHHFPAFTSRHHAETSKGTIAGQDVLLLKPQTYMNRSGLAVGEAMRFYKIPLEKVWVLHDDLDLALCRVKTKRGGGDGGHNGLKSIDQQIGKDYGRIRLGISRPEHVSQVTDYVLGNFTAEQQPEVETLLATLAKEIGTLTGIG